MASAVMIHAFVIEDYSIKYVQQPLRRRAAALLQADVVLGRPRRIDHVLGDAACRLRQRRRRDQPRAASPPDSLGRRRHRLHGDVLSLPDGGSQQSLRDVPHGGPDERAGAQPAVAELLHGHPSADAVPRVRRDDHSVRLRHRGARVGSARRLVAARGPQLDDDRVAVSDGRPDARRAVGLRRARLGWLLGLGSGRKRRPPAVVHRDRLSALRDGAGAPRDAEGLERVARHRHVLPHDFRDVHDAIGRRAVRARVRRRPGAGVCSSRPSWS